MKVIIYNYLYKQKTQNRIVLGFLFVYGSGAICIG
jgi:hypothetical protein